MTIKRLFPALLVLVATCSAQSNGATVQRPKITGISHVSFFTSDTAAAKRFYGDLLGLPPGAWEGVYQVGGQYIQIQAQKQSNPPSRISHVAFATNDAEGVRSLLFTHRTKAPAAVHIENNGTRWFAMEDPEGYPIEFVQEHPAVTKQSKEISLRIIHAGFVVHDRATEDAFYRDLLGFKLYWHGGMTDTQDDWVDMQVPDGAQWLEYMLVAKNSDLDKRTLGILNHVALGVADIKAAAKLLESRGWKPAKDEHPQLGKDGKWQLNLYDVDGTRVELMEFTPVQKPCCSPYVGPHPD